LVSNRGLDIDISEYEQHFAEEHAQHSNALQSIHKDSGPYLVGPLARFNLNFDRLTDRARQAAERVGCLPPITNPFQSILVRAVEFIQVCEEGRRLIEAYQPPAEPYVEMKPRAGVGYGCTEAPRGICWHRYRLDDQGLIQEAKIVPPTSQNQRQIEDDLRHFVGKHLHLNQDELTWKCEQAVRNYDPCISCATHALKVRIDRA